MASPFEPVPIRPKRETVAHVTDRDWVAMKDGAEFDRWPGDVAPGAGERVVIFDRNLDFTQHDVRQVDGHCVWVGPAIPWPDKA